MLKWKILIRVIIFLLSAGVFGAVGYHAYQSGTTKMEKCPCPCKCKGLMLAD